MAAPTSPRSLDRTGWGISDPGLIKRRAWISIGAVIFVFSALLLRLWYLQVVEGAEFLSLAQQNRVRRVPLAAPRGPDSRPQQKRPGHFAAPRIRSPSCPPRCRLPNATRKAAPKCLQTLGFLLHETPAQIENHRERSARSRRRTSTTQFASAKTPITKR